MGAGPAAAQAVSLRSAVKGAAPAAIGFEILKQGGDDLPEQRQPARPRARRSGPIIGVLVFANLVAQFLLFITAWTATARENVLARRRPSAAARRDPARGGGALRPSPRAAVGLVGAGLLLGALFRRR